MRLPKLLQLLSFMTILALIYINMQMQIFDLAYQGKNKEKHIINLTETNGKVAYDILQLKSANNLGIKLLGEESDLKFRDNKSIIQLVTSDPVDTGEEVTKVKDAKITNPLLSLLSFKSEAEARTQETTDIVKPWRRK